jgi:hypothetical protein
MPKEEARTLLAQQIAKFVELEGRVVETKEELERYKRDRLRYTKVNIVMNERLFGEDIDQFWRYEISSPGRYEDFETQFELNAVYDALDMLDGNPEVQRQPPKLKKEKWSRGERLMFWGLIITLLGLMCTAAVVPELRNFVYKIKTFIVGPR